MTTRASRECRVEGTFVLRRSDGSVANQESADVFFAFPSGYLTYDCVTCEAKCCRGFGYHIQPDQELKVQLLARPAISLFVEAETGRPFRVRNCSTGCFFLNQDNRCEIHEQFGFDQKPETCRLFPFNLVRKFGKHLVVAPHQELCPLDVTASGQFSDLSSHAVLLLAMQSHGVKTEVNDLSHQLPDISDSLTLEREIVHLSERWLASAAIDFVQYTLDQVTASLAQKSNPTVLAISSHAQLMERTRHWDEILGLDCSCVEEMHSHMDRLLVAMTPFLRSQWVFPALSTRTPWPLFDVERVPLGILALRSIVSAAVAAGVSSLAFPVISRMCAEFEPLLYLLAYSDAQMEVKQDALLEIEFSDLPGEATGDSQVRYLRILKALLSARHLRKPAALGEIIRVQSEGLEGASRTVFLKRVARRLAGRLQPVGSIPQLRKTGKRLQTRLQHFVLAMADEDLVGSWVRLQKGRGAARA